MTEIDTDRNIQKRIADASQLIEDFNLRDDAEVFADPDVRLEFMEGLTTDEFIDLAYHVNARMRSQNPRERLNRSEKGAFLPMLGTPETDEKREAFRAGFDAIHDYLANSDDSPDYKLKGVGMAAEALVVWVHPFNDGNGRTSRFLGKFIEDGTTSLDELEKETVDNNNRLRMYNGGLRVDYYNTVKGQDIMWDDGELEDIKEKTEMPVVQGIGLSIKHLLENDEYRESVYRTQARYKEKQAKLQEMLKTRQDAEIS